MSSNIHFIINGIVNFTNSKHKKYSLSLLMAVPPVTDANLILTNILCAERGSRKENLRHLFLADQTK